MKKIYQQTIKLNSAYMKTHVWEKEILADCQNLIQKLKEKIIGKRYLPVNLPPYMLSPPLPVSLYKNLINLSQWRPNGIKKNHKKNTNKCIMNHINNK